MGSALVVVSVREPRGFAARVERAGGEVVGIWRTCRECGSSEENAADGRLYCWHKHCNTHPDMGCVGSIAKGPEPQVGAGAEKGAML